MILALTGYVAVVVLAVMGVVAMATAIVTLADWAETEHVRCRIMLDWLSKGGLVLHVLVFLLEWDLSKMLVLLSLVAHMSYFQLFKTYPIVDVSSAAVLSSVVALATNHVFSFLYFYLGGSSRLSFVAITGWFVFCVWATPMLFFITLTTKTLPSFVQELDGGGGGGAPPLRSTSVARKFVEWLGWRSNQPLIPLTQTQPQFGSGPFSASVHHQQQLPQMWEAQRAPPPQQQQQQEFAPPFSGFEQQQQPLVQQSAHPIPTFDASLPPPVDSAHRRRPHGAELDD